MGRRASTCLLTDDSDSPITAPIKFAYHEHATRLCTRNSSLLTRMCWLKPLYLNPLPMPPATVHGKATSSKENFRSFPWRLAVCCAHNIQIHSRCGHTAVALPLGLEAFTAVELLSRVKMPSNHIPNSPPFQPILLFSAHRHFAAHRHPLQRGSGRRHSPRRLRKLT